MIIFLDETEFIDIGCNFNIIVENHFLEALFLENVDFIDTKFSLNNEQDYQILKSTTTNTKSTLKLKKIRNIDKIYEITWNNPKTFIDDFTTLCYIENIDIFNKNKIFFEKHLNVNLTNIKKSKPTETNLHIFSSFQSAALEILSLQKKITAPNFMYYLFEDILDKKHIKTLSNISFLQ